MMFVDTSVESVHCSKDNLHRQTCLCSMSTNGCPCGERTVIVPEITGPDGGWRTRGMYGRDVKFGPSGLRQAFCSDRTEADTRKKCVSYFKEDKELVDKIRYLSTNFHKLQTQDL